MNDIALYRKYRPQTFKDVLGQEEVVRTLESAIKEQKIAHAYLFSGSRGTGKTSIARIFAREIGCTDKDLYEIDAASNRGIDDVRELRASVHVFPFESPYKVYIVDEVHMLTKEAFNALLKTLEEPPSHVVFILATTEPHKLPDTVVSRCQAFAFKKPSHVILKKMVEDTAKKEGYALESSSADLLALLGDGSYRDTLGILQKVLFSSSDKKIAPEVVESIVGAPPSTLVNDVIESIGLKDAEKGLRALRAVREKGTDMKIFAKLLIRKARAVLLLKSAPDMERDLAVDFSEGDYAFLKKEAIRTDNPFTSDTLRTLLDAYSHLDHSHIPELPLELALIDLISK